MSKIQLWSQGRLKNNTRKGKTYDILLSIQSETAMVQKYWDKETYLKKRKRKKKRATAVPDLEQIMHQLEAQNSSWNFVNE